MQDQELEQMDRMREENKALRAENDKLRDELFAAKHNRNMNEFKMPSIGSAENIRPTEMYKREEQEQSKLPPSMPSSGYPTTNHVRTSIESAVAPSPSQDLQNRMNMDDLNNNRQDYKATTDPLTNFKRYLSGDQPNNRENSGSRTGADEQYKAMESYKAQNAYLGNQKPLYDPHQTSTSQQRDYSAPSDFFRRGLDPSQKGYDYKNPKDIEVTNVDESEKKSHIRSFDYQPRDYAGLSSYN